MLQRPAPDEFASFYAGYVARVPDGDVLAHLRAQGERTARLLAATPEALGDFAYAPGKWTVKRLLQHVVDGERLFTYRALCIARGEQAPLPGFDENAYAEADGTEQRRLAHVAAEYGAVRAATSLLFDGLPPEAWARRGIANGQATTVRALAFVVAGHELHHLAVLRERYGMG